MRNWPSDSRGSLDHEEKIAPSRRKMRFWTEWRSTCRVPVLRPVATHCRTSGQRHRPQVALQAHGSDPEGGTQASSQETFQKR